MSDYADKNELYHWMKGGEAQNHKYISRVWKNGKWNYTYDRSTGSGSRDNRSFSDRFKDWMGITARKDINKKAFAAGSAKERFENTSENKEQKAKDYAWKKNAYDSAVKKYNKTPLGRIENAPKEVAAKIAKAKDYINKKIAQRQESRIKVTNHKTSLSNQSEQNKKKKKKASIKDRLSKWMEKQHESRITVTHH